MKMTLEVVQKEQYKRLVIKQTKSPFQRWESIQEIPGTDNGNTTTLINPIIKYELPITGKIANVLTGSQVENKIRQGIEQAAQTAKQRFESS